MWKVCKATCTILSSDNDSVTKIGARDIINLTKLDWNSTDFCKRMPVTLSVSKAISFLDL